MWNFPDLSKEPNLLNNKKRNSLKNKRLFTMHNRFRKYSPLYFIKKAGAALVKTITSLFSYAIHLWTTQV